MSVYYFKAYTPTGEKHAGTIEADDPHAAAAKLQKTGIEPYFLHDYRSVKKAHRKRRKRRKIIFGVGALAIILSLISSALMVDFAGREQALSLGSFGIGKFLAGSSSGISGETEDHRLFAKGIFDAWDGFAPDVVTGVNVSNVLMTIHVNREFHSLSDADVKALVTNSLKTMQRRFNLASSSLILVKDDQTIMEASFAGISNRTTIKEF